MSKQAGRMSQGANDFLQPCTPTITGATNVGTGRGFNDGAVDISFSASCPYPATSYTVLSSGGQTATGATSPIRVTGLAGGTAYTFQVKGPKTPKPQNPKTPFDKSLNDNKYYIKYNHNKRPTHFILSYVNWSLTIDLMRTM